MTALNPLPISSSELSDRERDVLEAVVRRYVDTAEPAGSRTLARAYDLGVSAATIRNTMADLEEKGYLSHPHTSAGRVPTDLAYRFFVDSVMSPRRMSGEAKRFIRSELDVAGASAIERLIRQAVRAISLFSDELGVAVSPTLRDAVLERVDLIRVSSDKVMLVSTVTGGIARTLYAHLSVEIGSQALARIAQAMNERLSGLTLRELGLTLHDRMRDTHLGDPGAEELVNIFVQSGPDLFESPPLTGSTVMLGQASVLANQPEFARSEQLKGLISLTERRDVLARAMGGHRRRGGLVVTIGGENDSEELSNFTLVTSEYRAGGLKGVIGVIGPTRMAYEKVVTIVDYTSTVMTTMLES
ncbi:MAG: heat-inducible transcription repressor HrcA [Gemmatimonadetes bacterium]|nr:heat-inducible transcription repressor HrcA [Gemmatimonadota bacterium]